MRKILQGLIAAIVAFAAVFGINLMIESNPEEPVVITVPVDDLYAGIEENVYTLVDSLLDNAVSKRDRIGVNITWASDDLLRTHTAPISSVFKNYRWFYFLPKDYDGGVPSGRTVNGVSSPSDVWQMERPSNQDNASRIYTITEMSGGRGVVGIAPENPFGNWPCKNYSRVEYDDVRVRAREWARNTLKICESEPTQPYILYAHNEEWCPIDPDIALEWTEEVLFEYLEYLRRGNRNVDVSIGAYRFEGTTFNGTQIKDGVISVSPNIYKILNRVGGRIGYHFYPSTQRNYQDNFMSKREMGGAHLYNDLDLFSTFFYTNFPNITVDVGETNWTSSDNGVLPSPDQAVRDFEDVTSSMLDDLLSKTSGFIFVYQIADHSVPEGKFTGTGIYPNLIEEYDAYLSQPLRE